MTDRVPGPDPAAPLWLGTIVLRMVTWLFAAGVVVVHAHDFRRPWLAWTVLAAMAAWTATTSALFAHRSTRLLWLAPVDVAVTCGLMLTSPWVLSDTQYATAAPLITTVWAAVPPLVAGTRTGVSGGIVAGLVVAVATGFARKAFDLGVARDGVLLVASGMLIGMAATTARRSAAELARALRAEAATAERERLARSIHDSVLQVLARVRRRGAELGGEAAELALLAGEQEIALRVLVNSEPKPRRGGETRDLRTALQLLATPKVQVSAPAGRVALPAAAADELVAVAVEALANVDRHAGPDARAWVLLEDLGTEVVLTIRDDGPGIPGGRLERAAEQGRLGVAKSIRGRVAELGGTVTLETAPGAGTEWEIRVPTDAREPDDERRAGLGDGRRRPSDLA